MINNLFIPKINRIFASHYKTKDTIVNCIFVGYLFGGSLFVCRLFVSQTHAAQLYELSNIN